MKKLRTIIIDDEELAIEGLELSLKEHCDDLIEFVEPYKFTSPAKFLKGHDELNYDLLFLDIQFDKEKTTGFEIIKRLKKNNFVIIFTTGYSEKYANESFDYLSLIAGFLRKPYGHLDLVDAVKNAKNKVMELKNDKEVENNAVLQHENQSSPDTMCVYRKGQKNKIAERIKIEEIKYIEAVNQEKYVVMKDNAKYELLDPRSIKMEELIKKMQLPENYFKLINRGVIVNGDHIAAIDKTDRVVIMKDSDKKFSVSGHFNDIWTWWTQKKQY